MTASVLAACKNTRYCRLSGKLTKGSRSPRMVPSRFLRIRISGRHSQERPSTVHCIQWSTSLSARASAAYSAATLNQCAPKYSTQAHAKDVGLVVVIACEWHVQCQNENRKWRSGMPAYLEYGAHEHHIHSACFFEVLAERLILSYFSPHLKVREGDLCRQLKTGIRTAIVASCFSGLRQNFGLCNNHGWER